MTILSNSEMFKFVKTSGRSLISINPSFHLISVNYVNVFLYQILNPGIESLQVESVIHFDDNITLFSNLLKIAMYLK